MVGHPTISFKYQGNRFVRQIIMRSTMQVHVLFWDAELGPELGICPSPRHLKLKKAWIETCFTHGVIVDTFFNGKG